MNNDYLKYFGLSTGQVGTRPDEPFILAMGAMDMDNATIPTLRVSILNGEMVNSLSMGTNPKFAAPANLVEKVIKGLCSI